MIHFLLKCGQGHRFDGWFRSGADFETQLGRGLIACTVCGSANVEKALMRPALAIGKRADEVETGPNEAMPVTTPDHGTDRVATAASGSAASDVAPEKAAAAVKALWSELQRRARVLREMSDYVGPRFAEEARRIHYGETKRRGVYGEASRAEVEALTEEGILAVPLPALPEDQN
ncbi:DUF1178 family protein [Fulvimarina sp. 2208YS6-2-32]|uniref:DUF1178 family protein n=1 Tax=Fulvimarina uroteuthidis TaxID=3098149 RepID=A0ABU5I6J6_9HYPH|nr:DUF1178 family protein [Fulvimarina sp. 2208YS6-2-32]MDY8110538.1 DUF1178 family protein [Fulvimarina sp. 2208YS6-2-32]